MNEADRHAFYEAEEELMALSVDGELLDKIERLWLCGDTDAAAGMLSGLTDLDEDDAMGLLRRVYDGEG